MYPDCTISFANHQLQHQLVTKDLEAVLAE